MPIHGSYGICCWSFEPSLSGLPLVPVHLALWSVVPSFVLHDAWPFGGAGAASAPLSGWPVLFVRFSFVWGWLGFLGSCWGQLMVKIRPEIQTFCRHGSHFVASYWISTMVSPGFSHQTFIFTSHIQVNLIHPHKRSMIWIQPQTNVTNGTHTQ